MTSSVRAIVTFAAVVLARGAAAPEDKDAPFPGIYAVQVPNGELHEERVVSFVAQIDFLDAVTSQENTTISFLVTSRADLEGLLTSQFEVKVDQSATEELRRQQPATDTLAEALSHTIPGFPCYRNVAGTFRLIEELVDRASGIASLEVTSINIGDSYEKTVDATEGHDMVALKLTGHGAADRGWTTDKGVMYVTCGIHAREYATPELCARWAELLVDGYGTGTRITSLLDHTEVYLVPQANPDGRVVAENNPNLYWRKNTRTGCADPNRRGVDLNRNFPFKWGLNSGSSRNPCASTYRGPAPASEPEVRAIVEHMRLVFPASQRKQDPEGQIGEAYPEDVAGVYVDVHSYGELVIWPWSHVNRVSPNDDGLQATARKVRHFNGYALAGPRQSDFLYKAAGTTDEFAYGELGTCGLTYELGTGFYQDCPAFDATIAPNNLPSLTYLAGISPKPFTLAKGPDVTSVRIDVAGSPTWRTVTFTVTASDRYLSAGPDDDFLPVAQTITSVAMTFDMHPADKKDGASPPILRISAHQNRGTVVLTESYDIADIASFFVGPTAGDHIAHVWGVDDAGYEGPVLARSFSVPSDHGGPGASHHPTKSPSPTKSPTAKAGKGKSKISKSKTIKSAKVKKVGVEAGLRRLEENPFR